MTTMKTIKLYVNLIQDPIEKPQLSYQTITMKTKKNYILENSRKHPFENKPVFKILNEQLQPISKN